MVHITTVPVTLNFLRGQAGFMQAHGFVVHALSSPGESLNQFAASECVIPHRIAMTRQTTPLRDLAAIARITRVIRALRPAIVDGHTPKGGLLGMISAWLARTPVRIYHMHGLPFMTATGYRRVLLRCSEWVSCRLAHRVICVSDSLRDVATAEGICPPEKIVVLGGGTINGLDATGRFSPARIDASARTKLRQQLNIPPDSLVVGFVGRLVRDKGIVELARAWASLRDRYPGARLVLVGPIEPQDPVPQSIIESLLADSNVRLLGETDDPARFYAISDIVVLPSYREGFGIVLLEAAAMERPVVATRIPGCVDAVQDGVTGTLVPPRDANALAEAIERYLRDPELRRRHGHAGRERVLREFRQEAIWDALYGEYARLLAAKGIALSSHWNIDDSPPKSVDHQNVSR